MAEMTVIEAVRSALREEMARDDRVFVQQYAALKAAM